MPYRRPPYRRLALLLPLLAAGCLTTTKAPEPPKPEYSNLGPKDVPPFLDRTIYAQTDLQNFSPLRVSGYGLVVNLDGTGDTHAPNSVREFIQKQLQTHGFGSSTAGMQKVTPDTVLNDPNRRVAIVRVDAYIPAGAHAGQAFDARVSALDNSNTTSLNHGELYQTDLAPNGADPFNPGGGVINYWAKVAGDVAINPAYAMATGTISQNQKASMRYGIVMNRAIVAQERPLFLKLRQPERRLARQIENRINERFQDAANERGQGSKTAVAKDEGEIWLYVPAAYGEDWERFVGVVMHLYNDSNADFAAIQAKKLAEQAVAGDDAHLLDFSYCWEGMGEPALPAIRPLYNNANPGVAYVAARAGAFIGDLSAQQALTRIAQTKDHPYQVNAVEVLGALPGTAQLHTVLRSLLDSDQLLVRIAAYKAMLADNDPIVTSTPIGDRFTLDFVESDGPPVIYASRVGEPRIALIGRPAEVTAPGLLMAMDDKLSVVADKDRQSVQIYYRGDKYDKDATIECRPDLRLVIARLGGTSASGEDRLTFHYTDVVGILQKMVEQKMIASTFGGSKALATFNLQTLPDLNDAILSAPTIPEQRPSDLPTTRTALRE